MKTVQRFDFYSSALALPARTGTGALKVEGYLTRSGLFEYKNDDGTIRIEYRPPEEVYDETSIDSMRMVPVVVGHPESMVDLTTIKELRVGTVSDRIDSETRRNPDNWENIEFVRLRANAIIEDQKIIDSILAKEKIQLSCGYSCELGEAGVTPQGERYDAIQRKIRYNHLALVDTARAGPDYAIRVDEKDTTTTMKAVREKEMKKIVIKGITFEAPEQTAEAVSVALQELVAERDAANAKIIETVKRADSAEARADVASAAEKKAIAEAEAMKAKVMEGVKARRALERDVASVLGESVSSVNFDESDDDSLIATAIRHVNPELNLEGKSRDYLVASFDFIKTMKANKTEEKKDSADEKKKTAGTLRADSKEGESVESASEKARQAMIERSLNAYKAK